MAIRTDIDRIAKNEGISAVLVVPVLLESFEDVDPCDPNRSPHPPAGEFVQFRGDEKFRDALSSAIALHRKAASSLGEEKTIRIAYGPLWTLSVQRGVDDLIAVATPTGHAIAKSIRRLISRSSRGKKPGSDSAIDDRPPGAPVTPRSSPLPS